MVNRENDLKAYNESMEEEISLAQLSHIKIGIKALI